MTRALTPGSFAIPQRDTSGWPSTGELLLAVTDWESGSPATSNLIGGPTSSPAGLAFATVTRTDDYTVTSTTFIDLDSTNLSLTITVGARRRVLVVAVCDMNQMVAAEFGYLDFTLDGVRVGTTTNGLSRRGPEQSSGRGKLAFAYLTTPLVGTHTFKLQARVNGSTGRFGLMFWGGGSVVFTVAERG